MPINYSDNYIIHYIYLIVNTFLIFFGRRGRTRTCKGTLHWHPTPDRYHLRTYTPIIMVRVDGTAPPQIVPKTIVPLLYDTRKWPPEQDSNPHLKFRRLLLYSVELSGELFSRNHFLISFTCVGNPNRSQAL